MLIKSKNLMLEIKKLPLFILGRLGTSKIDCGEKI